MKKDCSAIILAAGNSARMGQIKFTLRMKDGKTFLEHILHRFIEFGCSSIVVVINRDGHAFLEQHQLELPDKVDFVVNDHPGYGRFYSLKLGLSALGDGHFVFIHNADNPFVEKRVLEDLYAAREEAAIIKPVYKEKGGHPILITDKVRAEILAETGNNIRLDDFLRKYVQKKISTDSKKIHVNVNTMEDFRKL